MENEEHRYLLALLFYIIDSRKIFVLIKETQSNCLLKNIQRIYWDGWFRKIKLSETLESKVVKLQMFKLDYSCLTLGKETFIHLSYFKKTGSFRKKCKTVIVKIELLKLNSAIDILVEIQNIMIVCQQLSQVLSILILLATSI